MIGLGRMGENIVRRLMLRLAAGDVLIDGERAGRGAQRPPLMSPWCR